MTAAVALDGDPAEIVGMLERCQSIGFGDMRWHDVSPSNHIQL
jgi:hypothetical protein